MDNHHKPVTAHDEHAPARPAAPSRGSKRAFASRRGLTLCEVMMSLVLIGTTALAGLSAMIFAYRLSDANLRQLGALSAARAIAEQISTLDFDTLSGSTLPVDLPSSTTGSLASDTWNTRSDDIHATPGNPDDDLVMQVRPEVTQSSAASGFTCSQVVIRFRWEENSFFTTRTREDALTIVLSSISSY